MASDEPEPTPGDDKDWTWAAERPCPDCGFDPLAIAGPDLGDALRNTSDRWRAVVGRAGAGRRPAPGVWSPLEYGCHVRDVHRLFTERVALMLAHDDPAFANWDQDAAAVDGRYFEQDPGTVADEIAGAADAAAAQYDAVPADHWQRTGRRSNGSAFTVLSIGRYHLHDVVHHLHDVQG
jgi:hypothetical protein